MKAQDTWCVDWCVEVKEAFPEISFSWGRGANFRTKWEAEEFLFSFCESQRTLLHIIKMRSGSCSK